MAGQTLYDKLWQSHLVEQRDGELVEAKQKQRSGTSSDCSRVSRTAFLFDNGAYASLFGRNNYGLTAWWLARAPAIWVAGLNGVLMPMRNAACTKCQDGFWQY